MGNMICIWLQQEAADCSTRRRLRAAERGAVRACASNVSVCVWEVVGVCVRLMPVCTTCACVCACGCACACVFVSLTLAGRQEERRTNQRARFHKSWLLIGQEGKGIVNKEKSLSGTAPERAPTPPLRPPPPLAAAVGAAPVSPVCVSASERAGG